ncbi:MAG: sulfatase [Sandaracinaceae bacterium]
MLDRIVAGRLAAALVGLLALACSRTEPEPALPPAAQPPPVAQAPERVVYDLARHVVRAELHHRGALVVDLGTPAGQAYTLGGWRTRAGTAHRFDDGTTATLITHVTGFLRLPVDGPGACTLTLRALAPADGRLTLYLDDQVVGHGRLPADGTFGEVQATVPRERCTAGEHTLRVRVPAAGRLAGHRRVGLAIDYLRLGPAVDGDLPAPPPARALARGDDLHLPPGWSLTYPYVADALGETLSVEVAEGGAAELRLDRERGAPTVRTLGPGSHRVPLATPPGALVRIRLGAGGRRAVLRRPRVVAQGSPASSPDLERRPRHVLIYLTDTLRADKLRPYAADARVATPELTTWARRAATFLGAHSQENWTKPSVATLLSGLYPWEHGATTEDARVPAGVELLGERLRAAGYRTAAFIANGFVSDRFGFRQGWARYRNYIREGRRTPARFVIDDVLAWLSAQDGEPPFFLYVHTIDPHVPYAPPEPDLARYDALPYRGPVDFGRDRGLLEAVKSGRLRLDARDRVRLEALYDGEITYHDRHFGRLLRGLEAAGLADDTLVVFTSDHGEELFDHGSVGHGHSVYEELLQVPLLLRIPGLTDPGQRVPTAVGLVDVLPTVLDVLGQPVPAHASGRSLLPLLLEGPPDAPRATTSGFLSGWRTVVVGRLKLVQRTADRWQVFDLVEDPGETRDLAPERPQVVRYLRGLLGLELAQAQRRHARERGAIDATLRSQLEALGYAGEARAPSEAESVEAGPP